MKLKTNLFEQITQHFYEDGGDIHWWIDEEDVEDFISTWCDDDPNNVKKTNTRVINGKQWNEFWIGGVYGDYEGEFVNEICPTEGCGHLLVEPSHMENDKTGEPVDKPRFCSNHDSECGYTSESLIKCHEANEKYWSDMRNKPPEKQLRLVGEDVFQFVKRVGLSLDRKDNIIIKDKNYWSDCTVCKRTVPASDFYIGQETGFAVVHFSHDDCTNSGPSIGVTFSKKTKEAWCGILGK